MMDFEELVLSLKLGFVERFFIRDAFERFKADGHLKPLQRPESIRPVLDAFRTPVVRRPLAIAIISWLHYSSMQTGVDFMRCMSALADEHAARFPGKPGAFKARECESMWREVRSDPAKTWLWLQGQIADCRFAFLDDYSKLHGWYAKRHVRDIADFVFALHSDTWPAKHAEAHGPCFCAKHKGTTLAEQQAAVALKVQEIDDCVHFIVREPAPRAQSTQHARWCNLHEGVLELAGPPSRLGADIVRQSLLQGPRSGGAPKNNAAVVKVAPVVRASLLERVRRAAARFCCPPLCLRIESQRAAPHPPRAEPPNDGVPPVYRHKTSKQTIDQHVRTKAPN